jgi:hypothetical protein
VGLQLRAARLRTADRYLSLAPHAPVGEERLPRQTSSPRVVSSNNSSTE